MRADHEVDAIHYSGAHELLGATGQLLLGVLKDEAHLAGELVAARRQHGDGAKQHGRVAVMAARVHDAG